MPGMNGTGPMGEGPRTGWGSGRCRPPKKQQSEDSQVEAAESDETATQPETLGRRVRGWLGGGGGGGGGGRGRGRGGGMGRGRGRGFGRGRGRGQGGAD
jgi:hypothetical protein